MFYRDQPVATTQTRVREFPLLGGERLEEQYVPDKGLVVETPSTGRLLVLTNKRLLSFVQGDSENEVSLVSLENVNGVVVKANAKGFRDIFQGLAIILVGIVSYFIIGYALEGIAIASAVGIALIFVGTFFIARYFLWEEEGEVSLQIGGDWDLQFPYHGNTSGGDVYVFINRLFELKQAAGFAHYTPRAEQREYSVRPHPDEADAPNRPFG